MTQEIEDVQGILDSVNEQMMSDADDQVRKYNVCKTVYPRTVPELDEIVVAKVMHAYEIALIDMWDATEDIELQNKNSKKFDQICKKCVEMMLTMPIPKDTVQRCMHIIKLISYACLGDRWGGVMQYLDENKTTWSMPEGVTGWNHRVLVDVCKAIVHLAKKESLDDLTLVSEIIRGLRVDQKAYEKEYLDDVKDDDRIAAADELAALYHLAKAVDQVGVFMIQGMPADAQKQVDFHFKHAQIHAQSSGHIEMDIILFVLYAALKKMMRNSV